MKGLMVALLTLLTASLAAAQQEDDGGTFVLNLNEDHFQALLKNEKGLIANIPLQARGNVTRVVVKLEDAVRNREIARISGKPTLEPSSQAPALDPSTNSGRRPTVTQQTGGFRNPIQNPRERRQLEPMTQLDRAPAERLTRFDEPARNNINPETFLPFGDDSDFAPVVDRASLQRERGTLQRNDEFRGLNVDNNRLDQGNLRQANAEDWRRQPAAQQEPIIPNFDRNRFQNNDRNRTNDLAQRNINQNQDFNNRRQQPVVQNDTVVDQMRETLRDSQDVMNQQKLAMDNQQIEIEQLRQQLIRERNEAAARQSINNATNSRDFRNEFVSTDRQSRVPYRNTGNYSDSLTQTDYNYPQDRIARNDRAPTVDREVGPPTLQIRGNDRPSDERRDSSNENQDIGNSQLIADKNLSLRKANNFLLFMLLASIGLNIYLGLISRTFYTRYEELADELRETFTATM